MIVFSTFSDGYPKFSFPHHGDIVPHPHVLELNSEMDTEREDFKAPPAQSTQ
jgi:hypothetical protein